MSIPTIYIVGVRVGHGSANRSEEVLYGSMIEALVRKKLVELEATAEYRGLRLLIGKTIPFKFPKDPTKCRKRIPTHKNIRDYFGL